MISLGNYTPTGVLSTTTPTTSSSTTSNEQPTPEVDEFGRIKANPVDSKHSLSALQRREDRRLKDRLTLVDTLQSITEQEKGLILANRLCEVSTERKRILRRHSGEHSLYMQLDHISSIYNPKGEEIQFDKKIETCKLATVAVLDDVQVELISISSIMSRLEQFREAYPVEYESAFISESIAELLQPLILLDLLTIHIALLQQSEQQQQLETTTTGTNMSISFKSRDWFQPISQFIHTKKGNEGEAVAKSAPMGSMMSMAAQINNLFDEEDLEDADSPSLLSKVRTVYTMYSLHIYCLGYVLYV